MEFLLSRYRNLTVLVVVIVVQLLLLAWQVKTSQDVPLIRIWAVTGMTTFAEGIEVVRRNTIGFVEDYLVLLNVREKNQKLSDDIAKLKLENQFLRTELQTADRVRALSAFQSRTPSQTVAARIIGTGTGSNSSIIFIDRGTNAGVQRGMAVITPDGIAGRVLSAFPTASQVMLITDPSFAAGVISQKNRVHGTVKGGQGYGKCKIDSVQNEEKVDVGDVFYTSGDDRVFPKGMPVGVATVVREGKNSKEIYLSPFALQNGLEEVLVVLEGIHQPIPDVKTAATTDELHLQAPPPESEQDGGQTTKASALSTDADRIRERYKKIGEAQNHPFGGGNVGTRPPDFTIDPDAQKKAAAAAALAAQQQQKQQQQQQQGAAAQPGQPTMPKPVVPLPGGSPAGAEVKPAQAPPVTRPPQLDANGAPIPRPKPADPNAPPAAPKVVLDPVTGLPVPQRPAAKPKPKLDPVTGLPIPGSAAPATPVAPKPVMPAPIGSRPAGASPGATQGTAQGTAQGTTPGTTAPKPAPPKPRIDPVTGQPIPTAAPAKKPAEKPRTDTPTRPVAPIN